MKEIEHTPMWVLLVYANIHQRKMAIWLIISCAVFGLYCLPWPQLVNQPSWSMLFRINDWAWAGSVLPLIIWYLLALKWVDKHQGWEA